MLLVEHTRCAEHGELVHGGRPHHHDALRHGQSDVATFRNAPDEGSNEAHEHCALSANHREALILIVEARVFTHLDEAPEDFTLSNVAVVAGVSRFRVAPKNSPPA
jgi:hypothetical protein